MVEWIEKLAVCVERGKVNKASPYPPDLKDQEGADELAKRSLDQGLKPSDILEGCMIGMEKIGAKFSKNEAFVPELLMAAKAMNAVMVHLEPFFKSGDVKRKGTFVIGTVIGDLHDIGKKLVSMVVEGNGWKVVDLGVDVSTEKFLDAIQQHPDCILGLSALLTTTMINMQKTVEKIKAAYPKIKVLVGGAPLTQEFADQIGADGYSSNPQGAVKLLN
ncbi:MAG: corrinoid protein [Candidatus Aminicenantes bacterium]|nr:corrinoid protein [Candidatus Aminicenantes bacterium]